LEVKPISLTRRRQIDVFLRFLRLATK
jgi:hypothetical protein